MPKSIDEDEREEREREANFRWGNSNAYQQSQGRWSSYTDDDKARMDAAQNAVVEEMAHVLRDGKAPESNEAQAVAEKHRLFINEWFYDCDVWMHAQLADMYVYDERFAAFFDDKQEGLSGFFSAAIEANTLARGGDLDVDSALSQAKASAGLEVDHAALKDDDVVDEHAEAQQEQQDQEVERWPSVRSTIAPPKTSD